jgi:acetylornithine/succinyldiaminopimelate/putrescine aminotransferase
LLLIFDEVQAGMGRTGRWFAYQHWNVLPDAVTLAKALAGGIACGGMMCRAKYADLLKPGTHAATFGGNPIACRAALATIETIEEDGLLERAEQIGERFRKHFEDLKQRCTLIQQIRIKGTMIGVDLSVPGTPIVEACMKRSLLINCTHNTVLRLLPALTISDELIDEGCGIMEEALLAHK